jgi:esterase/lipase
MKSLATLSFIALVLSFFPSPAMAGQLTCGATVIEGGSVALLPASANEFTVETNGTAVGTLKVEGHPLSPKISLQTPAGETQTCVAKGDLTDLYDMMVTDPASLKALVAWKKWTASRPKACAEAFDSEHYFQPGSKKIALVIHGYGSDPLGMLPVIQILLDNGYNVLAPRLSRHFTLNLHDLDSSNRQEWINDSEEAFAIAKEVAPKVTLVGFSLGGLLSIRLALQHPANIQRLALIAPAWRLSNATAWASATGSLMNMSLNQMEGSPIACRANEGYVPATGGWQTNLLTTEIENQHNVYDMSQPYPSSYGTVRAPQMVLTSDDDEAVDSVMIREICDNDKSLCTNVEVSGLSHMGFMSRLNVISNEGAFKGHALKTELARFLL